MKNLWLLFALALALAFGPSASASPLWPLPRRESAGVVLAANVAVLAPGTLDAAGATATVANSGGADLHVNATGSVLPADDLAVIAVGASRNVVASAPLYLWSTRDGTADVTIAPALLRSSADRIYATKGAAARPLRSVATRLRRMTNRATVTSISAAATAITYQIQVKVPSRCNDVRAVFTNAYRPVQVDLPVGNAFTITASLCFASNGASFYPLTFGGATSYTFPANFVVDRSSDPLPFDLPPGTYYIRACCTVADTNMYIPVQGVQGEYNPGDGRAATDLTQSGSSISAAGGGAALYSPVALVGVQPSPLGACLGMMADSLVAGTGDTFMFSGGWAVRGLMDNPATNATVDLGNYTTVNVSHGGSSLVDWTTPLSTLSLWPELKYADVILIALGTNDMGAALGQGPIRLLACWRRAQAFGVPLIAATLPPLTNSSDGYATTANQTVRPEEPKRLEDNLWLRDGAPISLDGSTPMPVGAAPGQALRIGQAGHPISRLWDVAKIVEFAKPNGDLVWTLAYGVPTTDGTHPATVAAVAMAAAVNKSDLATLARVGLTTMVPASNNYAFAN